MTIRLFLIVALTISLGAAFLMLRGQRPTVENTVKGFVQTRGPKFEVDGRPYRFVGANVAIMYREADRQRMPETLARASELGMGVIRVWAFGEGGPKDIGPLADLADWPR